MRAQRQHGAADTRPLLTRDLALTGDAPEAATALLERLERDPVLAGALFAAEMDPREYVTFAMALTAARVAHGFVAWQVLPNVPPGVPSDNVAFVAAHERDVIAVLRLLELED